MIFLPILIVSAFIGSVATTSFDVQPFKLDLSKDLVRMNSLVNLTRLPARPDIPNDGDFGISLARVASLKEEWVNDFDWNQAQASLNSLKQYTVTIEGLTIHYVYEKSRHKHSIPLLLLHGWPGSFHEFSRVIKPLTELASAASNGTTVTVSYDVIVPSLPGFVASSPAPANWTVDDTARVFQTLMVDVLGYKTYAVHGTDWGSTIAYSLYSRFTTSVRAGHFTFIPFSPPSAQQISDAGITLSEFGQFAEQRFVEWSTNGQAYFLESSTKPNTLGLALQDNPVGQLAWLAEKFDLWSDPNGELNTTDILTATSLYFLSQTFLSSNYIYAQNPNGFNQSHILAPTDAPILFGAYKWNIVYWPKEFVAKVGNLVVYNEHEKGGHFQGLDNAEALIEDLREIAVYF
ncbi:Alpha/Beta hydrolase protein [Mycena floridula]|nr:Alpha/Beta hydrolase protein [Mycena floridula]